MACGRERSVSIFTLLHLAFRRRKPVEDGIKGEKKKKGGEKTYPNPFLFTCSASQNCFDVIWLKVIWVCDCVYLYVCHWFQRPPRGTDVASPNPDIKAFGEFWPALGSNRHSLVCMFKCNVGFSIGTLHNFLSLCWIYGGCGQNCRHVQLWLLYR